MEQMKKKPILIQGAMEEETAILIAALEETKEITLGVWQYTLGTLEGYPVVISRTRIGMTNAAAATTLAIEHFSPVAIINQGTAGGHDPALHQMDIVLATEVLNMGAFKTTFMHKGEGMNPTTWEPMALEVMNTTTKTWDFTERFVADASLLASAQSVKATYTKGKVIEGIIGSGDLWNKEIDRILWFHHVLGTSAEEMEAAASAQIAQCYGIPFLCIRILSNNEVHMETFDGTTGEACQLFVLNVVRHILNDK